MYHWPVNMYNSKHHLVTLGGIVVTHSQGPTTHEFFPCPAMLYTLKHNTSSTSQYSKHILVLSQSAVGIISAQGEGVEGILGLGWGMCHTKGSHFHSKINKGAPFQMATSSFPAHNVGSGNESQLELVLVTKYRHSTLNFDLFMPHEYFILLNLKYVDIIFFKFLFLFTCTWSWWLDFFFSWQWSFYRPSGKEMLH